MAQTKSTLPEDVLRAIEELVKAAEQYGWFVATRTGDNDPKPAEAFTKVQAARRALTDLFEEHARGQFSAGIEIGLAQAAGGQ